MRPRPGGRRGCHRGPEETTPLQPLPRPPHRPPSPRAGGAGARVPSSGAGSRSRREGAAVAGARGADVGGSPAKGRLVAWAGISAIRRPPRSAGGGRARRAALGARGSAGRAPTLVLLSRSALRGCCPYCSAARPSLFHFLSEQVRSLCPGVPEVTVPRNHPALRTSPLRPSGTARDLSPRSASPQWARRNAAHPGDWVSVPSGRCSLVPQLPPLSSKGALQRRTDRFASQDLT